MTCMRYFGLTALAFALSACGSPSFTIRGSGSSALTTMSALEGFSAPGRGVITAFSGAGAPASLTAKLFAAYVSASADCSNPILLQDYGATPQAFDVVQNPTLFSGSPANGTYPCLIMKSIDTLSFRADATAVAAHSACVSTDTTHTFDTYRDGDSTDGLWLTLDGTSIDATGSTSEPGEDTTYTFFSTDTAAIRTTAGTTPHAHQRITLSSALVVPGAATLYMDYTNGIGTSNGNCSIVSGSIGFR